MGGFGNIRTPDLLRIQTGTGPHTTDHRQRTLHTLLQELDLWRDAVNGIQYASVRCGIQQGGDLILFEIDLRLMQDQVRVDIPQTLRHDCNLASARRGNQCPDLTVPVGDVKCISIHDRHFPDTGTGNHFRRDPADAPQPDNQYMRPEQPFSGILPQQQFCPALPVFFIHH